MTAAATADSYLTTTQAAKRYGVIPQRMRALLAQHRIPGARRHGPNWMIPADFVVLPAERRPGRTMQKLPNPPASDRS